jgi:hypothetical protein
MAISVWYVFNIISSYRPSIEHPFPTEKGGSEVETPNRKVATLHTYLLGEPAYHDLPQSQSLGQLTSDLQSRTDTLPLFADFDIPSRTAPIQVPGAAVAHHRYGESLGQVTNKL